MNNIKHILHLLYHTLYYKYRPLALMAFIAFIGAIMASPAYAAQPVPWQLDLQPAATPLMEQTASLHTFLLYLAFAISLFVLLLLAYVMIKFNAKANPVPSKTSHNTPLEIIWTLIPVLILIVVSVPSFSLLYAQKTLPPIDMTIKATGYQWYWGYEYPDHGNIEFDALMLFDDELAEGQPRLLATDNPVVVPVNTNVRVIVTAADVIHNWAMPAFGIKMDAVPGRLNETWFRAEKTGTYYGQCSELCGTRHAFMPIMVKVVTKEEFDIWVEQAKKEFAHHSSEKEIAHHLEAEQEEEGT